MGVSDRRILWQPRGEPKFVVGSGSQITLYEWDPTHSEIHHISTQHDLQFMKCFAWSPDPTIDDLVAVGLGSGKVDLLRLETPPHAATATTTRSNHNVVLSSSNSPIASLPVLKSRACNAISFCHSDPNLLAVGLDKVRGDGSLMVWDINTTSTSFTSHSALGLTGPDVHPPQFAASASVGPTSPPPNQKKMMTRQHPIPRGDVGPRTDERVLQQHAPTETVSSVEFLRESSYLLLAGISYRWLRLFDLRTPVPFTTNAASKIHGIATDPLDPNRIASFGDGTVTLWDSRKLPQPVLTFNNKDALGDGAIFRSNASYVKIEFSSTRRGTLAVLEREASHVRFWDLTDVQPKPMDPMVGNGRGGSGGGSGTATGGRPRAPSSSGRTPKKSWTNLSWGGGTSGSTPEMEPLPKLLDASPTVLSDTRKTKTFSKPLISFALVPSSAKSPMTSDIMVVHQDGDLELFPIHDAPKQVAWSSRGDFRVGTRISYRIFPGYDSSKQPPFPEEIQVMSTPSRLKALPAGDSLRPSTMKNDLPVLFGRGDKEGFPALSWSPRGTVQPALSPPMPTARMPVYSPSQMRSYTLQLATPSGKGTPGESGGLDVPTGRGRRDRAHFSKRERSGGGNSGSRVRHGKQHQLKTIAQIVRNDISMTMRRRSIDGYGLSNPLHNAQVTREEGNSLSDLWSWISDSSEYLCNPAPRINGYDFAYTGILGIWDGLVPMITYRQKTSYTTLNTPLLQQPQRGSALLDVPMMRHTSRHGNDRQQTARGTQSPSHEAVDESFHAALVALATRKGGGGSSTRGWKPPTSTGRIVQRQVALQLCGWNLSEDGLFKDIKRWEEEGHLSRAACWLVFTKHYGKAIDLLMRSEEETHQLMSGTLAALTATSSSKSSELREHCERLIVRIQDPYFRAMLTQLTSGDWKQILEEEVIPLRERLAIALQFLDDKSLTSYLGRCVEQACSSGLIDALVITGLTTARGWDVIQGYVDHTGDVQTAAILGSFVPARQMVTTTTTATRSSFLQHDRRIQHWIDSYRDLLDGMKLFHYRVGFDIERGQLVNEAMDAGDIPRKEWVPKQIIIKCNYCNKPIKPILAPPSENGENTGGQRPTVCQNCSRSLPRCSVCLMVLQIVPDEDREAALMQFPNKDTIDDAIVTCQTCRHGGHASHILQWFYGEKFQQGQPSLSHGICAVASCDCRCGDEFQGR